MCGFIRSGSHGPNIVHFLYQRSGNSSSGIRQKYEVRMSTAGCQLPPLDGLLSSNELPRSVRKSGLPQYMRSSDVSQFVYQNDLFQIICFRSYVACVYTYITLTAQPVCHSDSHHSASLHMTYVTLTGLGEVSVNYTFSTRRQHPSL